MMNIKKLIDEVTTQTVIKLKKSNMMKDDKRPAFKKTEEVLKNYNKYKAAIDNESERSKTKKLIAIIDRALKTIENDPYYEIIERFYFNNETRESIAEYYDVDVKTISRNKRRLINNLKVILFSDDTIEELFLE